MRIITTVGTSLFTNYQNRDKILRDYPGFSYRDINSLFKNLEDLPASEYFNSRHQGDKMRIKRVIQKLWISKEKSCAELQTLYKIIEEEQDAEAFEVYLLATDTVLSVLACELIKEFLLEKRTINGKEISCVFNNDIKSADTTIISGLQVDNAEKFKSYGVDNLLKSVRKFSENRNDIIFNISGGYKITIPYLTLYAQIYNIRLNYLYDENSDKDTLTTLLEVPVLPFSFEQSAVYRYYLLLQDGKDYFSNNYQKENEVAKELIKECNELGLLNGTKITSLGSLFKSYVTNFFAESKGSLGFFMEHKLLQYLQYYDNQSKKGRVLQSVEIIPISDRNNIPKGNEIDIFIETEGFHLYDELIEEGKRGNVKPLKSSYITIEVKPLEGIDIKQFELFLNRVKQFWSYCLPKEVRIIIYSFLPEEYALHKFNSDNRIVDCANKVKGILGNIPFKVQLVNFNIAFSKNDIKNELMKEHLKQEHFIGEQLFIDGVKQTN